MLIVYYPPQKYTWERKMARLLIPFFQRRAWLGKKVLANIHDLLTLKTNLSRTFWKYKQTFIWKRAQAHMTRWVKYVQDRNAILWHSIARPCTSICNIFSFLGLCIHVKKDNVSAIQMLSSAVELIDVWFLYFYKLISLLGVIYDDTLYFEQVSPPPLIVTLFSNMDNVITPQNHWPLTHGLDFNSRNCINEGT